MWFLVLFRVSIFFINIFVDIHKHIQFHAWILANYGSRTLPTFFIYSFYLKYIHFIKCGVSSKVLLISWSFCFMKSSTNFLRWFCCNEPWSCTMHSIQILSYKLTNCLALLEQLTYHVKLRESCDFCQILVAGHVTKIEPW